VRGFFVLAEKSSSFLDEIFFFKINDSRKEFDVDEIEKYKLNKSGNHINIKTL